MVGRNGRGERVGAKPPYPLGTNGIGLAPSQKLTRFSIVSKLGQNQGFYRGANFN